MARAKEVKSERESPVGAGQQHFVWYACGAVLLALVSMAVQLNRIGDPLGGYHSFNEGFYFLNAMKDLGRSPLAPISQPLDANNPFLYPLLLSAVMRMTGASVAVARMLSVVASGATVILTFLLGNRLYRARIGFLAAGALAFMPGVLLVGRNIQVDILMLALEMALLWTYCEAVARQSVRWAVAAGVLAALGVFTKLPVVLVLVALVLWQTWSTRGVRWITERLNLVAALTFVATAGAWYLYRLLQSSSFAASQSSLAGTGGWRGLGWVATWVLGEQFWMLSPVLAALAIAGVVFMVRRRQSADLLVVSVLLVNGVVFLFYNYHSYYFLPLAPMAALAVARLLGSTWAKTPQRALITIGLILLLVAPFDVLMLTAKKYTMVSSAQIPLLLERSGFAVDRTILLMHPQAAGVLGPPITVGALEGGLRMEDFASKFDVPDGFSVVVLGPSTSPPPAGLEQVTLLEQSVVTPVVLGYKLRKPIGWASYFAPGEFSLVKVGPPWRFGFERFTRPYEEYALFRYGPK